MQTDSQTLRTHAWFTLGLTILISIIEVLSLPFANLVNLVFAFAVLLLGLQVFTKDTHILTKAAITLAYVGTIVANLLHTEVSWIIAPGIVTITLFVLSFKDDILTEEVRQYGIPTTVYKIERTSRKEISLDTVKEGDILFVEGILPVDGILTEGRIAVDESIFTGYQEPNEKTVGQRVFAGTKILEGKCLVRVTAVGESTLLERQQTLLRTRNTTLPSEKKIESVNIAISYIVVILSVILAFWYRENIGDVFFHVIGVLLAGSVCASTYNIGKRKLDELAKKNVFVKDGKNLEDIAQANTIVFDKTGIVTRGRLVLEHVVSFKPYTQQQVLNIAAALETRSSHRVGQTIVAFAKSQGAISFQTVDDFSEEKGKGVAGTVNGKKTIVGSAAFVEKKKIKIPAEAMQHKEEGKTVIYVVSEKKLLGYIALSDSVRDSAAEVVRTLKEDYRTYLLSGDHIETAAAVGKKLGVHEVLGDISPQIVEQELRKLKEKGKDIIFVTNGEPTLVATDITMASSRIGKAGAVLLSGTIESIPLICSTAKNSLKSVKQIITGAIIGSAGLAVLASGVIIQLEVPVLIIAVGAGTVQLLLIKQSKK